MPETTCAFCAVIRGGVAADLVADDAEVVAFLDRAPLQKGHTLVVPRQHVTGLPELPDRLLVPLFSLVRRLAARMPLALGAEGTFVACNNTVSQSVPHLHVHVVPRTRGDGLRGFFWPRHRYASEAEAAGYAAKLRRALAGGGEG